jgi:hypothetical protein
MKEIASRWKVDAEAIGRAVAAQYADRKAAKKVQTSARTKAAAGRAS